MSIAVLKRKTGALHKNVSTGVPNFSLNGGHRNQGYIGQDSRSRSYVRSYERNGALKGHGGCCGQYPVHEIKTSSDMSCLNDASVIKPSCLSTTGMIMTKYRWIRRPDPYTTVKPDNNRNVNDQGTRIDRIARAALIEPENCPDVSERTRSAECMAATKPTCTIVKPDKVISGEDYIRKLNKKCANLDVVSVKKSTSHTPFSCGRLIVPV
jgi:hypothetical protein